MHLFGPGQIFQPQVLAVEQVGAVGEQVLRQSQRPALPHSPGKGVTQVGQIRAHGRVGLRFIGSAHGLQVIAGVTLSPGQPLSRGLLLQGVGPQESMLLPAVVNPEQQVAVAQRFEQVARPGFRHFDQGSNGRGGKGGFGGQAAQGAKGALEWFTARQGLVTVVENGAETALRFNVVQGGGVHAQAVRQAVGDLLDGLSPLLDRIIGMQIAQSQAQSHGVGPDNGDQPFRQGNGHPWEFLGDEGQGVLETEYIQPQGLSHRVGHPLVTGGDQEVGLGRQGAADDRPQGPFPQVIHHHQQTTMTGQQALHGFRCKDGALQDVLDLVQGLRCGMGQVKAKPLAVTAVCQGGQVAEGGQDTFFGGMAGAKL